MTARRLPKASPLNKEPYRQWYEFLKRAKVRGMVVSKDYAEWGDTSIGFDRWWTSHGSKMFTIVSNGVDLATEATATDDNYYLFAIPKHLSPRQTRDEAEKLMKRLKSEHGLTQQDIFGSAKRGRKASGSVAPKFKDPISGATWTGRGKAPKWIEGQDRSQFIF